MEALGRALGLHDRCREGLDGEVGLRIALLEDAGAVVGLPVTIHVLAVDLGGHVEVFLPGLWGLQASLFQHVLAVIDHLEVAIDHQQLGLAADLLAEFTEIRRDIGHVDLGVLGDIGIHVFQESGGIEFHAPACGEDADVYGVGSGRPVVLDLREDFREGNFGHNDLAAGGSLEFLAAFGKAAGDHVAGASQDVDGDAVEFAGLRCGSETAGSSTRHHRSGDQLTKRHLDFLPFHFSVRLTNQTAPQFLCNLFAAWSFLASMPEHARGRHYSAGNEVRH